MGVSIEVLPKFPGDREETYARHTISILMDHHLREKLPPCPLFVDIDFIQGGGKGLWSLRAKVRIAGSFLRLATSISLWRRSWSNSFSFLAFGTLNHSHLTAYIAQGLFCRSVITGVGCQHPGHQAVNFVADERYAQEPLQILFREEAEVIGPVQGIGNPDSPYGMTRDTWC